MPEEETDGEFTAAARLSAIQPQVTDTLYVQAMQIHGPSWMFAATEWKRTLLFDCALVQHVVRMKRATVWHLGPVQSATPPALMAIYCFLDPEHGRQRTREFQPLFSTSFSVQTLAPPPLLHPSSHPRPECWTVPKSLPSFKPFSLSLGMLFVGVFQEPDSWVLELTYVWERLKHGKQLLFTKHLCCVWHGDYRAKTYTSKNFKNGAI